MNKLKFIRGNGAIPASLEGEDHISALVFYMSDSDIPRAKEGIDGFSTTNRIIAVSSLDRAESLGIVANSEKWIIKVLHYQLSEIFRINPAIILYLGIFQKPSDTNFSFAEVKTMQNFAGSKLRQIGVYLGEHELKTEYITALQGQADALELEDAPLSILFAPKITNVASLSNNRASLRQRVSIVIAQDGGSKVESLFKEGNTSKSSVTAIGIVLSLLSKSKVNQSISWVGGFPSGVDQPAFSDGKLYSSLDKALIDTLDKNGYIFLRTYPSIADSYISDTATMDLPTSDYATIERVRTMDKAIRNIRAYLLPELGANVYIDPDTGKLQAYSVAHLETIAGRALEDMQKAGELSGYKVFVDPTQNVLATSTIEFVIKELPVGVIRKMQVNIGFTDKL